MRRSAAPSTFSSVPRKRFKFNSPFLSNVNTCSPTSVPLRKLEESQKYFDAPEPADECFSNEGSSEFSKSDINTINNIASDRDIKELVTKRFKALYTKFSKKKNKTWENDGILVIKGNVMELHDDQQRIIAKKSQCSKQELDSLECGFSLVIGGKDVLIDEEYSDSETYATRTEKENTGSQICKVETSQYFTKESAVIRSVKPKNTMGSGDKFKVATKPKSRHDPDAPGAIVLSRESANSVAVVLDPYIAHHMRIHQIDGLKFLYSCVIGHNEHGNGVILADEMGLGKTLQCIALIWTMMKQGPLGKPVCSRSIIICPSSLVANWKKEFRKWLGEERIKVFCITAGESSVKDFASSPLYSVLVVSYEMFRKSIGDISNIPWGLVVCDEGHRLKNLNGRLGEALHSMSCKRRVVLTGTPVQNNLKEFYSLVEFVNPQIFGSARDFSCKYAEPIQTSLLPSATSAQKYLGKKCSRELMEITSTFILRRTNKINEKFLPKKEEHIIFCKASACLKEKYSELLHGTDPSNLPSTVLFELINKLKKLCNHPCLIKTNEIGIQEVNVSDSTKLIAASDIILKQLSQCRKLVLVSNYTQTLDLLGYLCDSLKVEYHRLDGKTQQSKRQNMVDLFNSSYDKRMVFLLSSKAGGVGLNLVGGNVMVLYDIDWNPANDQQAMARVWRDGQKQNVEIYRLITAGTIEEKILQRQIRKQGLSSCVLDNEREQCSFTLDELRDIFSYDFETNSMTHDLLNCSCNGLYRPQDSDAGDDHSADITTELMTWEHAHHTDPNISFQFIKRKSSKM